MAFDLSNFDKLSVEGKPDVPKLWSYSSSADAVATIVASAYFNDLIAKLAVGDLMEIKGSDADVLVRVTSVTTNVTVETLLGQAASHTIVYAGEATTAGGDANESLAVSGVLATDLVLVMLHTAGSTPRTILSAVAAARS